MTDTWIPPKAVLPGPAREHPAAGPHAPARAPHPVRRHRDCTTPTESDDQPRPCAGPVGRRLGAGSSPRFGDRCREPARSGRGRRRRQQTASPPQQAESRSRQGARPSRPGASPPRPGATCTPGRRKPLPAGRETFLAERETSAQGKSRHPIQLAGGGPPLPRAPISTSEDAPSEAGDDVGGTWLCRRCMRTGHLGEEPGGRAGRRVRPRSRGRVRTGLVAQTAAVRVGHRADHRPRSGGPDAIGRGVVSGGGAVSDVSR